LLSLIFAAADGAKADSDTGAYVIFTVIIAAIVNLARSWINASLSAAHRAECAAGFQECKAEFARLGKKLEEIKPKRAPKAAAEKPPSWRKPKRQSG
jgi:hypothetical protein